MVQETCESATRRVRGPHAAATAPASPSPEPPGSIQRTVTRRRRAMTARGTVSPGCSSAGATISSPGRQSSPQSTTFSPEVVLPVSAILSAGAATTRPAAARRASASASMAWNAARLPRTRVTAAAAHPSSARAAASGSGPHPPVLR